MRIAPLAIVLAGCSSPWQRLLDREARALGVPGASLTVLRDGEVVFDGVTGEDAVTGVPLEPGALFRVGSATKATTAAVLYQLHDEGALSLEDPVVQWVPDAPVQPEATVDQLLRHVSGMGDYVDTVGYAGGHEVFDEGALLALAGQPTSPGRALAYSNAAYVTAGLVVEVATGRPWEEEAVARIIGPLDLDGGFPADGVQPGGGVEGGRNETHRPHATNGRAASAWVASTRDLAVFGNALVAGDLLDGEGTERLLRPTSLLGGGEASYGAGVDVGDDKAGRYHGHRGASPGYNAMWRHHVQEGLTIAVALNTSDAKSNHLRHAAMREARQER